MIRTRMSFSRYSIMRMSDLKPVQGCYYKWSDFKEFFLKKLNDYEKK